MRLTARIAASRRRGRRRPCRSLKAAILSAASWTARTAGWRREAYAVRAGSRSACRVSSWTRTAASTSALLAPWPRRRRHRVGRISQQDERAVMPSLGVDPDDVVDQELVEGRHPGPRLGAGQATAGSTTGAATRDRGRQLRWQRPERSPPRRSRLSRRRAGHRRRGRGGSRTRREPSISLSTRPAGTSCRSGCDGHRTSRGGGRWSYPVGRDDEIGVKCSTPSALSTVTDPSADACRTSVPNRTSTPARLPRPARRIAWRALRRS